MCLHQLHVSSADEKCLLQLNSLQGSSFQIQSLSFHLPFYRLCSRHLSFAIPIQPSLLSSKMATNHRSKDCFLFPSRFQNLLKSLLFSSKLVIHSWLCKAHSLALC